MYDLSDRRVALLGDQATMASRVTLEWDGRSADGQRVPPGLYLLRVEVKGDALTRTTGRLIGIAY